MPCGKNNNLIPVTERTPEERREITAKGGRAAGVTKRRRKTLKEDLLYLLSHDDVQENILLALLQKAMQGDVKAYQAIEKSIGEEQSQKIDIADSSIKININPDD